MQVTGGTSTPAVTISTGGATAVAGNRDSTVVGGNIEFKTTGGYFSVQTSVADTAGGLFSGSANLLQAAAKQTLTSIDISSVAGANDAVDILDGALAQVNAIRSDLGALQNRFGSTVSSLQFEVDGESNKVVVRIVDSDTKELIRQIPSEEMLAISESLDKLIGFLIAQKA